MSTITSPLEERVYNTRFDLRPTDLATGTGEHMVQERKDKGYLLSYPSQYVPGVVNQLRKRVLTQNLNIDTRFRPNYFGTTSSHFQLPLPVQLNNVVEMQLATIEFPTTYYVVSKQQGNHFFWITVNELPPTCITVPDGSYTNAEICTALNYQLSPLGVNAVLNTNGSCGTNQMLIGFTTVVDSDNQPLSSQSLTLQFNTNVQGWNDMGTPLPLKLGWMLGFRNGAYTGNSMYVSEGMVDMSGPRYVYLVVDDHNNNVNNSFYSAFSSSVLNKNILARISLGNAKTISTSVVSQNNLSLITTPREYFGPVNVKSMTIQLLDEYGRVVVFNNMDYSFCLTLRVLYDL